MNLSWNRNLFFFIRRRKKTRLIGHDIFATSRFNGKFVIINGFCISIKGTSHSLITSSISVKKIVKEQDNYFISFPLYLSGALSYKIIGLTYGFNINCSKLVNIRLK
jgi:hypothetical protein